MFLIGIFGIIALIYMAVKGLWSLIPWLILAVIVTSAIGFVLDHWVVSLIIAFFAFAAFGYYLEKKETKEKVIEKDLNMLRSEQLLKEVDEIRKGDTSETSVDEISKPEKTEILVNNTSSEMKNDVITNVKPPIHGNDLFYDYIIFDIETTGLNKQNDDVIQLSALKVINDKIVDKLNTFVKPKIVIPEKITYLTGIKNDDVYDAPNIDEVINKFSTFIEDLPLIGHNIIKFDLPFLSEKGLVINGNSVIDTVPMSTFKLPNLKNHRLPTLKKYFGIDNLSHNALNDCETNWIVYKKLRDNELQQVEINQVIIDDRLSGIRFSITGQFIDTSRDEIIKSITEHGGKYTKGISGKTNYLIVGKQIDERSITKDHSKTELKAQEMINNGSSLEIINLGEYKQLIS